MITIASWVGGVNWTAMWQAADDAPCDCYDGGEG